MVTSRANHCLYSLSPQAAEVCCVLYSLCFLTETLQKPVCRTQLIKAGVLDTWCTSFPPLREARNLGVLPNVKVLCKDKYRTRGYLDLPYQFQCDQFHALTGSRTALTSVWISHKSNLYMKCFQISVFMEGMRSRASSSAILFNGKWEFILCPSLGDVHSLQWRENFGKILSPYSIGDTLRSFV